MKNKKIFISFLFLAAIFLLSNYGIEKVEAGSEECEAAKKTGNDCTMDDGSKGICGLNEGNYICVKDTFSGTTTSTSGTDYSDLFGGSTEETSSTSSTTSSGTKCGSGFSEVAGVCMPSSELIGLSDKGVLEILEKLLSWLFALFSILSIMAFVVSGIQYLVAAGDTGVIEVAKRNAKWSVVGIIVGLSGYLILKAVVSALSGSSIF